MSDNGEPKPILDVTQAGNIFNVNVHSKNLMEVAFAVHLLQVELLRMTMAVQAETPQPKQIITAPDRNILNKMRGI